MAFKNEENSNQLFAMMIEAKPEQVLAFAFLHPDKIFRCNEYSLMFILTELASKNVRYHNQFVADIRNGRGENLFHILAKENFLKVTFDLVENMDNGLLAALMLTCSANGNTPLMIAVQASVDLSKLFWTTCQQNIGLTHQTTKSMVINMKILPVLPILEFRQD